MLYLRRIFLVWVVVRGEWLSIESIRVPYRILAPGCYRMIAGNVPGSVPAVSYKVRNLLVSTGTNRDNVLHAIASTRNSEPSNRILATISI